MELNASAAMWSEETRTQLIENACSITMLSDAPPTWCTSDMSPNEWTIIQNAIRGTISDDNIVIHSPCMSKHPLSIAALDVEMPLKQSKNNATGARRYALVPIIAFFAFVLVQYCTILFRGNASIVNNRALVERGPSHVPDSVISC